MSRRERMQGSIAWMAKNPVAANLIMFGLIACGVAMMIFQVRKEVIPQIQLDMIQVSVPYPGASPEEVEQGILASIEEVVRPIDGVKEVTATAYEGSGNVTIELDQGTDQSRALSDVKNAIDRITTFPKNAERPIVQAPTIQEEAIWLVFYGDQDPMVLRALAMRARDQLLELDEVSYVTLDGQEDLEIAVEVPQYKLRKYGLTLDQISQTVRQTALDLPAGGVKTKGGEVLLRTAERRDIGEEFANIPIVTSAFGNTVKLGDIAEITDGFRESDVSVAFEGKNVVWLRVYSVGDQSPPVVAAATKKFAVKLKHTMPPGVTVTTWLDNADVYSQRLDLLRRNASIGLVLVLVILGLFLEPRVAFWVTMGIPVSFLGSFVILPAIGVSLNMMSMFAFIIVLGMVVDDAIVVGENVYRLRREGVPPLEAAIRGAREVAMPVFFSVATTIVAFCPLLFIPGATRDFVFAIPAIVIIVLSLSLMESFFILPAHLAHMKTDRKGGILAFLRRAQSKISGGLERFIERIYGPFIGALLRKRWITVAVWIAVFTASLGLQAGGYIKTSFMPEEESDWVMVEAKLPFGVPVEETIKLKDKFVAAVHRVIDKNGGQRINTGILSLVGSRGSHNLRIWAALVPTEQRSISSKAFADAWREEVGDIPGLQSLSFNSSMAYNSKPIEIQLSHSNTDVLEAAAKEFADYLRGYEGVIDVEDGIERGKTQLDFTLSEEGKAAGFTTANVANQVRAAFYGSEALRQQRGRDEIRVIARLPRDERESLSNVEDLVLQTPSGGEMPLKRVAKVSEGQAYSSIRRVDGKRILRVKADVEKGRANPGEVIAAASADFLPKLQGKYPGLLQTRAGQQKEEEEFMQFLFFGFVMALLGIFGLIAVPLKSYLQPLFVVMISIPFGFVGAFLGHVLLDLDLCIFSWLGMVALAGVVVNDAIVFVHAANNFRAEGKSASEASSMAAQQRFRPIMLTSLTTFGGLSPMIFETSEQARELVPMAVSLGFGVLMSTIVILTLVPSTFVITENARDWWKRLREHRPVEDSQRSDAVAPVVTGAAIFALVLLSSSAALAQGGDGEMQGPPAAAAAVDAGEHAANSEAEFTPPDITPGEPITLDEAIRMADERNLSLDAARKEIESANADFYKAWGALLPSVNGSVTLTHLDYEDSVDFGGSSIVTRPQDTLQGALEVAVPIVSPEIWAGIRVGRRGEDVSLLTFENARQELLFTVARAYYLALTARTLIDVNEEQLSSISRHLNVAKARLAAGVGKRVDVVRARGDLELVKEQLLAAHVAFNNARDTLGMLVGLDGLPMPEEDRNMGAPSEDEPDLLSRGLENRVDLKLRKAVVDFSDSRLKLSWMQFLPSLNLSWQLGHQFTDPGDMTASDRTRWTAYLVLSVPIYNQTRYADLDKSRAAIAKAKIEVEDAQKNAGLEIRTAKRNYESALEKVASASTQADLAREILDITENEYTQGTGSSLDVTDARRSRNEAEINLAARQFEAQSALLELFKATGDDMGTL